MDDQNCERFDLNKVNIDPITSGIATIMISELSQRREMGANFEVLIHETRKQLNAIQGGDFSQLEAILYSQAITLQSVFNRLLGMSAAAESISAIQQLNLLALKAQNQCRATLATLANIKNPQQLTFIKQQNNAVNQQVGNNSPYIEEKSIHANELLSEVKNEGLDLGRTIEAVPTCSQLEALGTINRR